MNCGIYEIRNNINNNIYIGSSINISRRKTKHYTELNHSIHHSEHLQRAWNKYGKTAFTFTVLLYCEPSELLRYEQFLIDTKKPSYNVLPTAGSPLGYKHPKEFGDEIRRRSLGHIVSDETRKKISKANKGRKHTNETKEKMSRSFTGRRNVRRTYIGFISPDGVEYRDVFDLITFCTLHNLKHNNMYQVANGHKRIHKGWKRLNECSS
jgi:group I intron endonuclease